MQVRRDVLVSYQKIVKLISRFSAEEGHKQGKKPGTFQIVRAIELIFAPHFELVTGRYSWVSSERNGLPVCRTSRHAWLALRGNKGLILDVVPPYQPANIKVPTFVGLTTLPTLDSRGYIEEKIVTPSKLVFGVTSDIEALVDKFTAAMSQPDF